MRVSGCGFWDSGKQNISPPLFMQSYSVKHGLNKSSLKNVEFIPQLCLEVQQREQIFFPLSGPSSPDHAEWMALELYTDRKINASYQEASGVRLPCPCQQGYWFFFNAPKLSLPACKSHHCDLCGQTLTKEFPFVHRSVAWNLITVQGEFFQV